MMFDAVRTHGSPVRLRQWCVGFLWCSWLVVGAFIHPISTCSDILVD